MAITSRSAICSSRWTRRSLKTILVTVAVSLIVLWAICIYFMRESMETNRMLTQYWHGYDASTCYETTMQSPRYVSPTRSMELLKTVATSEEVEHLRKLTLVWVSVLETAFTHHNVTVDENLSNYLNQCSSVLRSNHNPVCTLIWGMMLNSLGLGKLSALHDVITKPEAEPIGRQHRMGGATFLLASPETNDWFVKAYFKPCRRTPDVTSEDFREEVLSFILDRLMSTFRVFPNVPRVIGRSEFLQVADDLASRKKKPDRKASEKAETYFTHEMCKDPDSDTVTGAMVGWIPLQFKLLYHHDGRKCDLMGEGQVSYSHLRRLQSVRSSSSEHDKSWAEENMVTNLFSTITHVMSRYDHNIFMAIGPQAVAADSHKDPVGEFFLIDNDRASWETRKAICLERDVLNNFLKVCRFARRNVLQMLLFHSLAMDHSIGNYIRLISSTAFGDDMPEAPHFNDENVQVLDSNLDEMVSIVHHCFDQHGESILLPDTTLTVQASKPPVLTLELKRSIEHSIGGNPHSKAFLEWMNQL